ncbi:MAG: twin-arginine translocase TatA/TatE family subunit [Anaerolineae bacterium]|nr:twin-arginine translocase TatA/TatE family subunit [Anaerolineae bacterium]
MFGLQPIEIIFTLVLALLLFGPKKLPEIARGLGNAIREFRESTSQVTEEFRKAAEPQPEPAPATTPRSSATIVTAPSVPAEPVTPAPTVSEPEATVLSDVEAPAVSATAAPSEAAESPPKP